MKTLLIASLLAAASLSLGQANFDDLSLSPGSYQNGAGLSGSFASHGFGFNNSYDPSFDGWAGFAYSNVNDPTTAGFGNQYAASTGTAHSGSNYGVAFEDTFTPVTPTITAPSGQHLTGVYVTNGTYDYLSMLNGDSFAKKFGGASGNDADWFLLTANGFNGATQTGTASFYLADYRDSNNANDYIVHDWRFFDLSGLGAATSVQFHLSSSDSGQFGMNTPAYFALDDVQAVPEPATLLALGLGLVAVARRRKA